MKADNLIQKGLALKEWSGEVVVELGDVKGRLFHLTPSKEMVKFEDGHPVNEWILVLKGSVRVETPHGSVTVNAGDSFIVPPETPHRLNVDAPAIGLVVRDMEKAPAHVMSGLVVDRN